ncbi:uncharacterized protein AMSG_02662 [Thecamonas trahens ATCC 50062]|uniref:Uncharacterized protein n=1 Tax=Thecamonas trahens ATCC 50062 TaxID=461836 RepID=A0A0L0D1Y0_THETB|nr:hypothetical protein AMSG_02662 [Thecamonas trahens ATCC 50062]KNC46211.1 hypothetical protein AMSG_02662 [Thecamonas trahens ATCC 50062]|eukprot:XP_013760508.1 hypothetical protein AMSG_02662 [Thecamonas trahens ATCC 50062]
MIYRVTVFSHVTLGPVHMTDLFIPPHVADAVEALSHMLTSSSSSIVSSASPRHHPLGSAAAHAWHAPQLLPRVADGKCKLGFGSGEAAVVVVTAASGAFPAERYAALLARAIDSDPSLLDDKPAFSARVAFEALPLLYHLVPQLEGELMRVKPEHVELAELLDRHIDGETSLGIVLALATGLCHRNWRGEVVPAPPAAIVARYQGIYTRDSDGPYTPPPRLVALAGAVIMFLVRYSWLRTPKRARHSRVLPFVRICSAVHPYDVLRPTAVASGAQLAAKLVAAAAETSPPVTPQAAELVYVLLDGFTPLSAAQSAAPLPTWLTKAIATALLHVGLVERAVLIPHAIPALLPGSERVHSLRVRASWLSRLWALVSHDARAASQRALIARLATFFDSRWALEHVALFSGVDLATLAPLGWDHGLAFETLAWSPSSSLFKPDYTASRPLRSRPSPARPPPRLLAGPQHAGDAEASDGAETEATPLLAARPSFLW